MSESTDYYVSWAGCPSFGVAGPRVQATITPPVVFLPTDLSNCEVWFDANNGDSITVDSKDGTSMLTWTSLGTSGDVMTPDTGTAQYGIDTINGLATAYFPASNTMSWYGRISNQEKTIFYVSKGLSDLTTLGAPYMDNITGVASGGLQVGYVYSLGNFIYTNCVNGVACATAYSLTNPVSNAQMTSWRITSNLGSNFFHLNSSNLSLTDNITAGSYNDNPIPYQVNRTDGSSQDVGEIIVYSRALPDSEVAQVESYLLTKWGLS